MIPERCLAIESWTVTGSDLFSAAAVAPGFQIANHALLETAIAAAIHDHGTIFGDGKVLDFHGEGFENLGNRLAGRLNTIQAADGFDGQQKGIDASVLK